MDAQAQATNDLFWIKGRCAANYVERNLLIISKLNIIDIGWRYMVIYKFTGTWKH